MGNWITRHSHEPTAPRGGSDRWTPLPVELKQLIASRLEDPGPLAQTSQSGASALNHEAVVLEWSKGRTEPSRGAYAILYCRRLHSWTLLQLASVVKMWLASSAPLNSSSMAAATHYIDSGDAMGALTVMLPHTNVLLGMHAAAAGLIRMMSQASIRQPVLVAIAPDQRITVYPRHGMEMAAARAGNTAAMQWLLDQQLLPLDKHVLEAAISARASQCTKLLLEETKPVMFADLLGLAIDTGDAAVTLIVLQYGCSLTADTHMCRRLAYKLAKDKGQLHVMDQLRLLGVLFCNKPLTQLEFAVDVLQAVGTAITNCDMQQVCEVLPAAMRTASEQAVVQWDAWLQHKWPGVLRALLARDSVGVLNAVLDAVSSPQARLSLQRATCSALSRARDVQSASMELIMQRYGLPHMPRAAIINVCWLGFRHLLQPALMTEALLAQGEWAKAVRDGDLLAAVRRGAVDDVRARVQLQPANTYLFQAAVDIAVQLPDPITATALCAILAPHAAIRFPSEACLQAHKGLLLPVLAAASPDYMARAMQGGEWQLVQLLALGSTAGAVWVLGLPGQPSTLLAKASWAGPAGKVDGLRTQQGLSDLLQHLTVLKQAGKALPLGASKVTEGMVWWIAHNGNLELLHNLLQFIAA